MQPRILIGICSCHRPAAALLRSAVRETWLRRLPGEAQAFFFVGNGTKPLEADIVQFAVDDGYKALPAKVQAFFKWAVHRTLTICSNAMTTPISVGTGYLG